MNGADLARWRAETDAVDSLVDGLVARDGRGQSEFGGADSDPAQERGETEGGASGDGHG